MRKTLYLSLLALCLCAYARGQDGYLNALNTTGNISTQSGNFRYTYSVGEVVAFNNSCSYTPGVIQPTCLLCVPVSEVFDQKYASKFYPNPASSHVVVETDFPEFDNYSISTIDGKLLETGKFDYSPIGLERLQPGTYLLRLSDATNQIFKSIKIIKQ